jgi:serine O-acetyltransferase
VLRWRETIRADVAVLAPRRRSLLFYLAATLGLNRFSAVMLFRISSYCGRKPGLRSFSLMAYRWNTIVNGCELHSGARIGPGLHLPHPNGVVFGAITAGRGLTVQQNVTIGLRDTKVDYDDPANFPVLGDEVFVGSGAAILGPIKIGDGVRVGANAVVLHDITPGSLAVGNPAQIRPRPGHDAQVDLCLAEKL